MILDKLKHEALKSIKENSLKLKKIFIGEVFTYVSITSINDENQTSLGVTLSAKEEKEEDLIKKDFTSLEEILNDKEYNSLSRVIALATINAVGQYEIKKQNLPLQENLRDAIFNLIIQNYQENDKIVFIGNLKPLVKKLKEHKKDVEVFCRAKVEPKNGVYNDIFEYEAVSKADIVMITGASLIGSTIDALLKFTSNAKMVILSGFSAGANPAWLNSLGISHVASLRLDASIENDLGKNDLELIFKNKAYIKELKS